MCENVLYGNTLISLFQDFLLGSTKLLFWQGDWALGYHSMNFKYFADISYFLKILSLELFGNLWYNSYKRCSSVIIAHRFTCGKRYFFNIIKKCENIMKLPAKLSFPFYVSIESWICYSQSYLGKKLLCVSIKRPKTNLKFF